VRRFIAENTLIERGDRVLAAVSGGQDSTCLLFVLVSLRASLGFELEAAHFDHGLRGKRAARVERRFVAGLCESLDVPLHTGEGDIRAFASKSKRSTEDAARELRYRFLARVASQRGCSIVATGHTKDDQAETVLLHLIRGSGLRGLSGMGAASPVPVRTKGAQGLRLARPLLQLTRKDTASYCQRAGIEPIDDSTNRSRQYARNRVRHELLPALREHNPRIEEALVRLADSASEDDAALEALGEALITEHDGAFAIRRQALVATPRAVCARAVRVAFGRAAGGEGGSELSRKHVDAVLRATESTGASIDVPRDVVIEVQRSFVLFRRRGSTPRALPGRTARLDVPGSVQLGEWRFDTQAVMPPRRSQLGRNGSEVYLDLEACGKQLSVRRRKNGDRFQPLGMTREKKLQDFFVDAHVPRGDRDATPLVCANGRIAWIVGHRPADWAKVRPGTGQAIRVTAERLA
jgi:tRNA(Ile)-lysidine synthase